MEIESFGDARAKALWAGEFVKAFSGFDKQALNRLMQRDIAQALTDLRNVRSNRLEALKGDREGQFGIRINDWHRVCFRWEDGNAGTLNRGLPLGEKSMTKKERGA